MVRAPPLRRWIVVVIAALSCDCGEGEEQEPSDGDGHRRWNGMMPSEIAVSEAPSARDDAADG